MIPAVRQLTVILKQLYVIGFVFVESIVFLTVNDNLVLVTFVLFEEASFQLGTLK
jgi:hypothetical protein